MSEQTKANVASTKETSQSVAIRSIRRKAAEGDTSIPIVGIGASAGGIEALSVFFDAMPADSGCAFVVVLHLDPDRESELAHILGARTAMPVRQVKDGMPIERDSVYVIAPDRDLRVSCRTLHMAKSASARGHGHPVDILFQSLALDQQEGAIAVVLSGTGSNGTEGLREIRAVGGMSMVQSLETAQFDGMPRSAISAGMADHVLAPGQMPEILLAYLRHRYVSGLIEASDSATDGQATLHQVLDLVRAQGGHDFRGYKHSTLGRRVQRRLGLSNTATLDAYMQILRESPYEVQALGGDLMISVTGFFRDAEAWRALTDLVIVPMVSQKEGGAAIRLWVPACSTGEEAFSLAMLVIDEAERIGKRFDLKVFATDAQEDNLRHARAGIYPDAAVALFSQRRRRRFFEQLEGHWQVNKKLRGTVVFAPQDLLNDPPFSRLDLVSCRNLLIYLEPDAQQKIIAVFHFAIAEGGHLFLGNAETIERHEDLFAAVSQKWRLYRRLGQVRNVPVEYALPIGPAERRAIRRLSPPTDKPATSMAELARSALLDHYAPASVLIDRKGRVLYFHGATGDYLEQPTGEPTRDLLSMARGSLAVSLRTAIRQASTSGHAVTVSAMQNDEASGRAVTITVKPLLSSPEGGGDYKLVGFALPALNVEKASIVVGDVVDAEGISKTETALHEEVALVRAELLTTVEHLETANEELKASNEEATSMNEELQSTNEELETSKEELQSYNEELNTVNSQLQTKIAELENATNDLKNLLTGSEIATLFLDESFCIKWSSPAIRELFDLVSTDVGRPISHFAQKFTDSDLLRDADTVLKKLTTLEAEVPSDAGRWYLRRIQPYRTQDNRIAGVVVTFIDISARKQEEDGLRRSEARLQEMIEALPGAVYITDAAGRITFFNPAVAKIWGRIPEIGLSDSARLLWPDGRVIPQDRSPMASCATSERTGSGVEVVVDRPDGILMPVLAYMTPLYDDTGSVRGAIHMLVDITEARRAEATERRLASIVASSTDAIISKDLDGTITSWNEGAEHLFGYSAAEMLGQSIMLLVPPDRYSEETQIISRIRSGEHIEHFETVRQTKDGRAVWVSLTVSPVRDAHGGVIGASKIARDMSERRHADEHRKTLIDELNHRVKNTLAVVQAIAAQTLGDGTTMKDARGAFGSRLIALATAHDILTRENWAGADLVDVVAETVKPHVGGIDRFRIEGTHVRLGPSAALAISMAIHELGTNAAKYGALSTPEGHVDITWEFGGDSISRRLKLVWSESGGPAVLKPSAKGFGSKMIERALALELNGEVRIDYVATGVVCTIDAPMPQQTFVVGDVQ